MSYTSLNFLLFVSITVLAYFLFPLKKQKWTVLLAASYVFYLFAGYKYVAFIVFTTLSTFLIGLWLEKVTAKSKNNIKLHKAEWSREDKKKYKEKIKKQKRIILALALVLNFGILALLKYYNFFAGSLNDVFGSWGMEFSAPTLKLFLPLGISFYTFQSMGYIVDVYREKTPAQHNPFKFALFVAFFPQIIQGPIGIYDDLAHQLFEPHDFDFTRFKHALELILWGLVKKMVFADTAVIAINNVTSDYNSYGGTTLTFTIILYAFQLYADFSGGIDISRGVAQIFGIDMMENFKRPYFSKDINEYWRRWHISLGNWFKNYLFYPLAMSSLFINTSKKIKSTKFGSTVAGAHIAKVLPTSIASFVVFFIVGVWHGASWKYVGFGVWNGGIIMISVLMKPVFEWCHKKLHINPKSAPYTVFQILRTFIVILVGYVFDVAPSFTQAMRTFWLFFTDQSISTGLSEISTLGLVRNQYVLLSLGAVFIFIISVIQERHDKTTIRDMLDKKPFILRWAAMFVGIMLVVSLGVYGSGFDAADFVYMQF
ncbi:MAG: MBOAT family O-acyltransferase [Ruminococcus bromii]|nr:MBOAT family protein [Ruminococcus bromii]MDY4085653.1 MBOAT family O-acyltransferase [Ruminococcus bromii]